MIAEYLSNRVGAVEIRGNLAIPSQSSQEDPGFPSDPILLQHLDEIFDITSSVGLEEFASVVIGGYQGTLLEQEKTALRYALSGYNSFTKHELVSCGYNSSVESSSQLLSVVSFISMSVDRIPRIRQTGQLR